MKQSLKLLSIMAMGMMVIGCNSSSQSVEEKMKEIENRPPLPVEPPPPYVPVPTYQYDGYKFKSPFIPTSVANELALTAGKKVSPNLTRPKQELEQYSLEDLLMKGIMRNASGTIVALIQTPDGYIKQVHIGNYMGQNYGRVIRILPNQVDLLEVVPDGQDGFIERPRTLILRTDS